MAAPDQNDNNLADTKSSVGAQLEEDEGMERVVEGFTLGKTIGKGGYGTVKIGSVPGSDRLYALKIMFKEENWNEKEEKNVANEVNCLKKVNHPNVIRLLGYKADTLYPLRDGESVNAVLLVMELCTGGELFDILFYTGHLTAVLARTYMKQLMGAVKAMHDVGVTHRDLKPQNLLLDGNFNLKVADFGLSKIFDKPSRNVLKTTVVGTRGFRPPEIVLERSYTNSCDIFSCGVIMFIMLWGYPPFEVAKADDTWYRPIATRKKKKFFKKHKKMAGVVDDDCKDLVFNMLAYQPSERSTLQSVDESAWMQGEFLEGQPLVEAMKDRHKNCLEAKKNDANKQAQLQVSFTVSKNIGAYGVEDSELGALPPIEENLAAIFSAFDTFAIDGDYSAYQLLDKFDDFVKEKSQKLSTENDPRFRFDKDKFSIEADLQLQSAQTLTLGARCFRIDDSENKYVAFTRTCDNFVAATKHFNDVLAKCQHMLGERLQQAKPVYDYSDITKTTAGENLNLAEMLGLIVN